MTRDGKEKSHLMLPIINLFRVQVVLLGVSFHNREIIVQQAAQ